MWELKTMKQVGKCKMQAIENKADINAILNDKTSRAFGDHESNSF